MFQRAHADYVFAGVLVLVVQGYGFLMYLEAILKRGGALLVLIGAAMILLAPIAGALLLHSRLKSVRGPQMFLGAMILVDILLFRLMFPQAFR